MTNMQKEQGKNKTKYESIPESMLPNDGALDTVIWIEQKESWGWGGIQYNFESVCICSHRISSKFHIEKLIARKL